MTKLHINNKGEVKNCKATIRACLYSEGLHFNNEKDAYQYLENNYSKTIGAFKNLSKSSADKPIDKLILLHHTFWRNRNNLTLDEMEEALNIFIDDNSYYGLNGKRKELLEYFTQMNDGEWSLNKVRKDLNNLIGV